MVVEKPKKKGPITKNKKRAVIFLFLKSNKETSLVKPATSY